MRTLVLAQAAALTGALVAGWYAAQALVLLPDADVDSVRAAMLRSLAVCVSGVLMIVAGLLVQAMCRIDDQDRDQNDRDRDGRPDRRPRTATGAAPGPRPGPGPGPGPAMMGSRSHRPVAVRPGRPAGHPGHPGHPQRQHRGRRRRRRAGRPARRRMGRTGLARAARADANGSGSPTPTSTDPAGAPGRGYLSTSPTTKNIEPRIATMSAIRLPGSTSLEHRDVVERRRAQLEPPRRLVPAGDQVVAVEAERVLRHGVERSLRDPQHLGQLDVDRPLRQRSQGRRCRPGRGRG